MISFLKIFLLVFALADFKGPVVGVIDGDTIEVLKDGRSVRIRLNGIDCPERSQSFGTKAKQYVSALVFNREVTVRVKELDRYGRSVADVYTSDGTWVNRKLIEEGLAWHYKRYSSDQTLAEAERKAKASRKGLWIESNPIPPWEFRSGSKSF